MPIYEYECRGCGKLHEIIQKITEVPLTKCPDCGGDMKKIISNTTFVLKGTGWYMTDYASGKRGPATESGQTKGLGNGSNNGEGKKEDKVETTAAAASK